MKRLLLVCALALPALACPKAVPENLAGSDDEQMDTNAAKLEELRTREGLTCDEWCSLRDKVCAISKSSCEIAGRHADREEFQKRCVTSQEDCAKFNESCGSCK